MDYVYELKELEKEAPPLFGVKTGTKIDEMFFKIEWVDGKPKKVPLGGIPYQGVLNVVGVPDTGKSVFVEQFSVVQASLGYRVVFVTTESPAHFLYNALKGKALALGVNFEEIEDNIIVVDASQSAELRENLHVLTKTMDYAIKRKKATVTVIDSITGLYEHKEVFARQVVRGVYNFLKQRRQTALLVSQKRSSQGSDTAEAAGGLAVAHILDGTIVFDKKVIMTLFESRLYKIDIGEVLRTVRIDGCRLAGHDSSTYVMEITDLGLIDIKEKLSQYIKR
ncbi:MAG: KaiC domain-containing protein [Candidatus Micrarchaeota archaeon]|nr:KaiC domain-containing protein [Candidatus Micrarchaeota archaeon]